MQRIILLISIFPVCLSGWLFGVQPALAKTIIAQPAPNDFQVTVKVVFDFQNIEAPEVEAILNNWQVGLNNIWNAPKNEQNPQEETWQFSFDLKIMAQEQTCADYPEYHCISVIKGKYNQRGNIADTTLSFANDNKNSIGQWSKKITANNAAHEIGHMLGLTDEYHYQFFKGHRQWVNDNEQPKGKQSIMAQTWGLVGVTSDHFHKILKSGSLGY